MVNHYSYRVIFSGEDNAWVGLCAEFPSLSHISDDQLEALSGINSLVEAVVEDMLENGEKPPEAISSKLYSGKISTRVTPEMHRDLAMEAAEAGVSINRLVNQKLSRPSCGFVRVPAKNSNRIKSNNRSEMVAL